MKSLLTTSFALCLCGPLASAAVIADYNFEQYASGSFGEASTAAAGNTDPRIFAPSTGLVVPTGIASISNLTITVTGTDLNVIDTNNLSQRFRQRAVASQPVTYSFSVTITTGYQINDFTLSFIQNGNAGAGPIAFSYDPNSTGSISMGSDTMNNNDTPTLSTSSTIATAVTGTVNFLITMTPTISSRNFRVDDFQLNGTVEAIPEPSTVVLVGLAGLVFMRRRRN